METKFVGILSASGSTVLKKRANILNEAAKASMNDIIVGLERELRDITMSIMNLEDLSVKTTDSLVVGNDFNAQEWSQRMYGLYLQKRDKEIELQEAKSVFTDYFELTKEDK